MSKKGGGTGARNAAAGRAAPRSSAASVSPGGASGVGPGGTATDEVTSASAVEAPNVPLGPSQTQSPPGNGSGGTANGVANGVANGSATGSSISSAAPQPAPAHVGRTEENGAVYYDSKTTWKDEFQSNRGEVIGLRDGEEVEVGKRYKDAGYYVEEGKQRAWATGSYYMSAGLDGVESVEADPNNPGRFYVTDRDGNIAAYDHTTGFAADESGEKEKTAAQMGAVMVGTRAALHGDPSPLAEQYRQAYDDYTAFRTAANNVKATDAFYAWSNGEGREVGFAHDGTVSDIQNYRRGKEAAARAAEQAAAEQAAAQKAAADQAASEGLSAEHQKLAGLLGVARLTGDDAFAEGAEGTSAGPYIPEPDPTFVMAKSHEEVAADIGVARTLGFRSFAVLGEPGTGKNFLLEQASAVEQRPHLELDVDETTEVSELFGAQTMKDGNIVFQEGKVTTALREGHRVVLNEANTAPEEVMTVFHNVVGSGNSAESRFITLKSPEAGETRVPVHPDAEIFFTYNPEGTGREGGLGRALADRVSHFHMRKLNADEGAAVVSSQANKFLTKAGKGPVTKAEAKKDIGFFEDLRAAYRDNQPGIVKEPDSRWLHRFTAFRQLGGREMALRRTDEFLDLSSAGEGEADQMKQTIRDLYDRRFGRG